MDSLDISHLPCLTEIFGGEEKSQVFSVRKNIELFFKNSAQNQLPTLQLQESSFVEITFERYWLFKFKFLN